MSLSQRWLKAAYEGSAWLTPLYPLGFFIPLSHEAESGALPSW